MCPSNGEPTMTVAASDLPPYLTRIFMDFQGEPDDQKRAAAEAANISQDDRLLLKKALEDYGHKVHPLSRLARLIRAGGSDGGNGKANGHGEGPTSDPALNDLIERVQKDSAPQRTRRRRTVQAKWGDAEWDFLIAARSGPATRTSRGASISTRRAGTGAPRSAQPPQASHLRQPGNRQASDRIQQAADRQAGPTGVGTGGGQA